MPAIQLLVTFPEDKGSDLSENVYGTYSLSDSEAPVNAAKYRNFTISNNIIHLGGSWLPNHQHTTSIGQKVTNQVADDVIVKLLFF